MCLTMDFHLAIINSSKPIIVYWTLQYKGRRIHLNQSLIISHHFFLLTIMICVIILLVTCKLSLKCFSFFLFRIHFVIPQCLSLMNTPIFSPDFSTNWNDLFAPSSSVALLLPPSFFLQWTYMRFVNVYLRAPSK